MAHGCYRTTIGLRVKDGIVLAVEKLVHSKLLVPGASNRRIQTIDKHIGLVSVISRAYHVWVLKISVALRPPPVTSLTDDISPIEQDQRLPTSVNSIIPLRKLRYRERLHQSLAKSLIFYSAGYN